MSRPHTSALGALVVLVVAACSPQAPSASTPKPVRKPGLSVVKPAGPPAGAVSQPGQATPTPAPTLPAGTPPATPGPEPSMVRATPPGGPTPLPSGYVASLPPGVFPSPGATPSAAATPTGPTPTPIPAPTIEPAVVVANSIPIGTGTLTGYVVEPDPAKPGEYRAVPGVTVLVASATNPSQKATLKNATNGTYKLPAVPLGEYYVRVEKSGYAADSAPTSVNIYPGYPSGHTLFLILPE